MRTGWVRPERRDMLRRVRALSALRAARHGGLPAEPDAWWQQIAALAAEHGIELPTYEQWHEASKPEQWDIPL